MYIKNLLTAGIFQSAFYEVTLFSLRTTLVR